MSENLKKTTLGGGCFWCIEALFKSLEGVHSVVSGYMGGEKINPTYEDVCSGTTGHAEVIHIEFDPMNISFREILEVFFQVHNPTTLNRQGGDVGTQYRSVVFYYNDEQKAITEKTIDIVNESEVYASPVVTQISKATKFYPAEAYHQDYFALNPEKGYCSVVIKPKMDAFKQKFKEKLK